MGELYPLRFKEILRSYSFGDRWIAGELQKEGLPPDQRISETWEVCDRGGESSLVVTGPLAGQSVRALIEEYGERLLGHAIAARFGNTFPLLIKFLDCTYPLAEQVHHSDDLARRHGLEDPGKTEAWYMLRTKPGATIHCGNRDGVTRDGLREAIARGQSRDCMRECPVAPGDAFLLYAGTMHYSSGGVLFYEIMQNSDVYIGLSPPEAGEDAACREAQIERAVEGVHLEDGFDCQTRPVCIEAIGGLRTFVLACRHFALERLDIDGIFPLRLNGSRFMVLSQIEGESVVRSRRHEEKLRPGNSCLVPACLPETALEGTRGSAILKAYVPDLGADIVEPLRAHGIAHRDIAALGGRTSLNDLQRAMSAAALGS